MIIDLLNDNISLKEALKKAKPYDTIILDDRKYIEKIEISIPHLTIIGRDYSIISYNDSHGTIIPKSLGGDGKTKYGTTGSSTFRVLETADYFTCKNITFENTFSRKGKKDGQAVAFKSEINYLRIDNCKFISEQDTLYIDLGSNNIISNSYIEGDVDFIFGSAECIFNNCTIKAKNINNVAYFTAPNTYVINPLGYIFYNCRFIADENMDLYLGRAWYPGLALFDVSPVESFIDCKFDCDLKFDLIQMHEQDPFKQKFKIYNSSNNSKKISNIGDVDKEINKLKEENIYKNI